MGSGYLDVRAALVADPYPYEENRGRFAIGEDEFFSRLYVEPSEVLEEARRCVEGGINSIRLVQIDGYAGSGKTLLAHRLMRDYRCADDFSYAFGTGEEESLSLSNVVDRMLIALAEASCSHLDKRRYSKLLPALSLLCEDPPEKAILHELAASNVCDKASKAADVDDRLEVKALLADVVGVVGSSTQPYAGTAKSSVDWQIRFLLYFDFSLRLMLAGERGSARSFCLLDNVDGLSLDSVVSLYIDIHEVMTRVKSRQKALGVPEGFAFIYLLPTREVTERKLRDSLSRKYRARSLRQQQLMVKCDLSSVDHREIAARRIAYWGERLQKGGGAFDDAAALLSSAAFDSLVAPLLNLNYKESVSRAVDLTEAFPQWSRELGRLQDARRGLAPAERAVAEAGERDFYLRLLLEYLKDCGAYRAPLDEAGEFDEISKLGLTPLFTSGKRESGMLGNVRVTTSRMLLTVLAGSREPAPLRTLESLFSDMISGEEVTASLYALCRNLREVWRRLVMFSGNTPGTYKEFSQARKIAFADPGQSGPAVEICLSGREYLRSVVPSFEFYLSRSAPGVNLRANPPLFSEASTRGLDADGASERGRALCFESIELVLRAVEACAPSLYDFGTASARRAAAGLRSEASDGGMRVQDLESFFFLSSEETGVRHTHLSRLVFSHVGYLERFRRYWLRVVLGLGSTLEGENEIAFNERMASYLIRYLALFDSSPFMEGGGYRLLLNNRYLPRMSKAMLGISHTCVDMVREIRRIVSPPEFSRYLGGISAGMRAQARSQELLLEAIAEIHRSGYRTIGMVEIGKEQGGSL